MMRCALHKRASARIARSHVFRIACARSVVITRAERSCRSNRKVKSDQRRARPTQTASARILMKHGHQLTGKVVVAAMGSDHAPQAEIDGALAAARDLGIGVILVGQSEKVEPELRRCGWRGDGDRGIELVEAAEVIGMDEPVATSVRRKKKSS